MNISTIELDCASERNCGAIAEKLKSRQNTFNLL